MRETPYWLNKTNVLILRTMKETLKQSGYSYSHFDRARKLHILRENSTGKLEGWVANKNHASYGIIYKNTHLEFVTSKV